MAEYIEREAFIADKKWLYCTDCDKRKGKKRGKMVTLYEIGEAPCKSCGIHDMLEEVEMYPTADVRPVVMCKDCGHWNKENQHPSKRSRNSVAMCAWFSRNYGTIETSDGDWCSYGYRREES